MSKDWVVVILFLIGVILGCFVGIKFMFIDGIIQIAKNINPMNLVEIAWGIIRIIFSGLVGWIIFLIFLFLAYLFR